MVDVGIVDRRCVGYRVLIHWIRKERRKAAATTGDDAVADDAEAAVFTRTTRTGLNATEVPKAGRHRRDN